MDVTRRFRKRAEASGGSMSRSRDEWRMRRVETGNSLRLRVLMALNVALLRSSFELVVEREPMLTARFYEVLFERYPQVRALFHRRPPEVQQLMLQQALVAVLDHIEEAEWLEDTLRGMGAQHVEYGVTDEMYDWVSESLLATIAESAGDAWDAELSEAWTAALGAITGIMKAGARMAVA
jgi:hemoglobin-like flavoprotein